MNKFFVIIFTGRVLLIKIDFNCHHTFDNHHKLMSENWFLIGEKARNLIENCRRWKLCKLWNVKLAADVNIAYNSSWMKHLKREENVFTEVVEERETRQASEWKAPQPSQVLFELINWSSATLFLELHSWTCIQSN